MNKKPWVTFVLLGAVACPLVLAAVAEEPEGEPSQAKGSGIQAVAGGVKQVALDGPKGFVEETVGEVPRRPSLTGVVERVNRGTERLLDHTVKGAYKVATLGQSELESYEIEEPEKGSDEPTKIKIALPGT